MSIKCDTRCHLRNRTTTTKAKTYAKQNAKKEKQKYLICLQKLVKIEMSLTKFMIRQSKHETKVKAEKNTKDNIRRLVKLIMEYDHIFSLTTVIANEIASRKRICIGHFQKYHNTLFVPPKFCISIAFIFS